MHTGTLLASLFLLGSTTLGPSVSLPDEVLKASDHKKLGRKVSDYWVAKDEKKKITAAFQSLSEEIDRAAKNLQKKKGPGVLAIVEDWEQVFWLATQAGLSDKKVKKGRVTHAQPPAPYVEFTYCVGKRYSTKKGPFPLILVVPDVGEAPSAALDESWEDPILREEAILVAVHMEGDGSEWGTTAGATRVMETYGSIVRGLSAFGLDYDRVFLAGSGKGFGAAAATVASFPQLFAGLIGRGEIPPVDARNFRNTPTYLTGGEGANALRAAIEELGFGDCTADGVDASADIWSWAKEHARVPYPAHISFTPTSSYALSANWIKLDGVDENTAQVDAVVDRSSNTFTITATGVGAVTVLFNDTLVDLEAPVKVIVNGVTHETVYSRNSRKMIDRIYNAGDWGRVFTASATFDVSSQ